MINKAIHGLIWLGAFGWAGLTSLRQGMDPYQGSLQDMALALPDVCGG